MASSSSRSVTTPQGYLVYTPDGHVIIQWAAHERRELFAASAHGVVLRETTAVGFFGYCGTFELRDSQVVHHVEVAIVHEMNGRSTPRTVVLEGDQLILATPRGAQLEWQRVH